MIDLEPNRQERIRCVFSGCNCSTENNAALNPSYF